MSDKSSMSHEKLYIRCLNSKLAFQIFIMNIYFLKFSLIGQLMNRLQSSPPLSTLITRVLIRNLISTCRECCRLLFKEKRTNQTIYVFYQLYRYPNDKAGMFVYWLDCLVFYFSCI